MKETEKKLLYHHKHQGNIDYVVAGQDNGGFGAMSALQALGNDTTEVYSMGGYGAEAFDTLAMTQTIKVL